jgi:hypothetical protein
MMSSLCELGPNEGKKSDAEKERRSESGKTKVNNHS